MKRLREEERKAKLSPEQAKREVRNEESRERRQHRQDEEWRLDEVKRGRQKENSKKLVDIILEAISGNCEAAVLVADCCNYQLESSIVSGLTKV